MYTELTSDVIIMQNFYKIHIGHFVVETALWPILYW